MGKEPASEVLSLHGREVRVTNPDKLYFSSQLRISKLDVVRYYLSVADGALAGIRDRPVVLKRFVDGAEGGSQRATQLARRNDLHTGRLEQSTFE